MISMQSGSEMSSPICVSFTLTLASSFSLLMRSSISRYCALAARASASFVTLSPSRSSEAVIFLAFNARTASMAVSSVSPATKRFANFLASPLFRTKRKIVGWLER